VTPSCYIKKMTQILLPDSVLSLVPNTEFVLGTPPSRFQTVQLESHHSTSPTDVYTVLILLLRNSVRSENNADGRAVSKLSRAYQQGDLSVAYGGFVMPSLQSLYRV